MRMFIFPSALRTKYRTANVNELLPITFSETDIDRMLTQIAERMVKGGRSVAAWSQSKMPDLYELDSRVEAMQSNPKIRGFSGSRGSELIRGWLLATVVKTIAKGKSRTGEKLDYIAPVTAAAYRSGLPRERQRHRRADEVVYYSMASELATRGETHFQKVLGELCKQTIGVGIDFGPTAGEPVYDNVTPLDINTVFALRFIETFPQSQAQPKPPKIELQQPAFTGAVAPMGRDLVSTFQIAAYEKWQVSDVYKSLSSILTLRLLQLPLRMATALRCVLTDQVAVDLLPAEELISDLTSEKSWKNPLEMYCDFTGQAGSASDSLAKLSVARDLDLLRGFFRDRMLIKALLHVANSTHKSEIADLQQHQVVPFLKSIMNTERVDIAASILLTEIQDALVDPESGEVLDGESMETFDSIMNSKQSNIQKFAEILSIGNEHDGVEGLLKWYRTVSGLGSQTNTNSTHVVQGTVGARQTWKYSLSDDMLVGLLDLCFSVDEELEQNEVPRMRPSLSAEKVISALKNRFGILIAEPPAAFDTPENRAAAAQNLEAFLGVLRQLGCYQGLSDDFNAQYVTRPRFGELSGKATN